jgi:hypothetical protein
MEDALGIESDLLLYSQQAVYLIPAVLAIGALLIDCSGAVCMSLCILIEVIVVDFDE